MGNLFRRYSGAVTQRRNTGEIAEYGLNGAGIPAKYIIPSKYYRTLLFGPALVNLDMFSGMWYYAVF